MENIYRHPKLEEYGFRAQDYKGQDVIAYKKVYLWVARTTCASPGSIYDLDGSKINDYKRDTIIIDNNIFFLEEPTITSNGLKVDGVVCIGEYYSDWYKREFNNILEDILSD